MRVTRMLPEQWRRRLHPFAVYQVLFVLLPFAGGGYFTWQWTLMTLVHGAVLLWQVCLAGRLVLPRSRTAWGCGAVLLAGAVWNLFSGIDQSASREGLFRMAACLLFALLMGQWKAEQRLRLLRLVPVSGAAMVLVSLAAGFSPALRPLLYENDRMAGPFQYANTFALFLLVGLAVRTRNRPTPVRMAMDALLLLGIAASGSRSGILLLGGYLLYLLVRHRPGWKFWAVLGAVAAGIACYAAWQDGWIFARFVQEDVFSTLWGRLLYMKDGVRLLAGHPMGVGWLGWFYLQRMIQTGVYNVRFVHNDLLQLALDYSLPAAAAALWWAARRLRKGACSPAAAVLIALHCLADPDLEFLWMAFLFILALSPAEDLPAPALKGRAAGCLLAVAVMAAVLPGGAADGAFRLGNLSLAYRLNPGDTEIATARMLQGTDLSRAAEEARTILDNNPYQSIAWQILAEDALSRGDYDTMAVAQRQAVILLKYDQTLYDDALARLETAAREGWSADRAVEEMVWLLDRMDTTMAETDPLGWKLKDQPELAFSTETRLMIHMLDTARQ